MSSVSPATDPCQQGESAERDTEWKLQHDCCFASTLPISHKDISYVLRYLDVYRKGVLRNVVQPRETDMFQSTHNLTGTVPHHNLVLSYQYLTTCHLENFTGRTEWLRCGLWIQTVLSSDSSPKS